MKIAIIGCGYIGINLIGKLQNKNHEITTTTNDKKDLNSLINISQNSLYLEPNDTSKLKQLFLDNHCIIITSLCDNLYSNSNCILKMSETIKSYAIGNKEEKSLIFISKTALYGDHGGRWVDEDDELKAPDDEYKILINAEKIFTSLKEHNINVTIIRSPNIYGPNKEIVDSFKSTYSPIMPGDGAHYTNTIHADDLASAIVYSIEHALKGIYNLSDDDHMTRQELADRLCDKLNLPKVIYEPSKADFTDYNKRVANYRIKEKGFILKYPFRKI